MLFVLLQATQALYASRPSSFGPHILLEPLESRLYPINAFSTADSYGCESNSSHTSPLPTPPRQGWIAIVQRGHCPFSHKVRYAQERGAVGVVFGDQSVEEGGVAGVGGLLTPWSPGECCLRARRAYRTGSLTGSFVGAHASQTTLRTFASLPPSFREHRTSRSCARGWTSKIPSRKSPLVSSSSCPRMSSLPGQSARHLIAELALTRSLLFFVASQASSRSPLTHPLPAVFVDAHHRLFATDSPHPPATARPCPEGRRRQASRVQLGRRLGREAH